jgi:arylsulfatase A-like enzyme
MTVRAPGDHRARASAVCTAAAFACSLLPLGCGRASDHADRWIRLATGEVQFARTDARSGENGRDSAIAIRETGGGSWLSIEIEESAWSERAPGTWSASNPLRGYGNPPSGAPPQRLVSPERSFEHRAVAVLRRTWNAEPGSFGSLGGRLLLRLEEGETPPPRVHFSVFAEGSRQLGGASRVAGARFSGDGFVVRTGERAEIRLEIPAHSALRMATTVEPAWVGDAAGGNVRFRVLLEDTEIFSHESSAREESFAWHEIPLPERGVPDALLRLEVDGGLAHSAFVAPVVGPAATGTQEPRDPPRRGWAPHIVVFLADTFRADSLAVYGGNLGITPHLDRLSERARVFQNAWSVGTKTLPAHLSLFSGVFPPQAGKGKRAGAAMPQALASIAEILTEHGYRTGAVTDSVFVSQRFGFDRGFAFFDEHQRSLDSTLARAYSFLDACDGRPVFLFVQTYRTHLPYRVSRETRQEFGEVLELGEDAGFFGLDNNPLQDELLALMRRTRQTAAEEARLAELVRVARSHYLGGVADLDRGFLPFFEDMERRGILRHGYLVFTSDHGEAFLEHRVIYHSGPVWNELIRIPLLIWSDRLAPGVVDAPVSLVDLPPTIAAWVGIPGREEWVGHPLETAPVERPVLAFESRAKGGGTLALIEEFRKIITHETPEAVREGEIVAAYDLLIDPHERQDLNDAGAPWPREMLGRWRPFAEHALTPLVAPAQPTLDAEKREQLRAMGYLVE